jgi:hypothetical protein
MAVFFKNGDVKLIVCTAKMRKWNKGMKRIKKGQKGWRMKARNYSLLSFNWSFSIMWYNSVRNMYFSLPWAKYFWWNHSMLMGHDSLMHWLLYIKKRRSSNGP